MAGMITHSWNGTILTITSDSGTSSMDLKGGNGDIGPRGPQGPAGIIINPDGTINYNGYATEQYVEDLIAQIEIGDAALEDYYTKEETLALIPNTSNFATTTYVQTAINESLPDLSSYAKTTDLEGLATEEYVDNAIAGVEAGDVDLTNYYTKSEVNGLINEIELTPGPQGDAGYTPIKGVDYYTTNDKNDLITEIITSLPVAEEVAY